MNVLVDYDNSARVRFLPAPVLDPSVRQRLGYQGPSGHDERVPRFEAIRATEQNR